MKCQICGVVHKLKRLSYGYANIRACTMCRFKFYRAYFIDQREIIRQIKQSNKGEYNGTNTEVTTA